MTAPMLILASWLLLTALLSCTEGHGRMWEPPSRQSAFRLGFNTTVNYNDHQMYCGGRVNQWDIQGGKCGICGDPWQDEPRDYERPDGEGVPNLIITRTYLENQSINVSIEVTANHLGWFEFRLCDVRQSGGIEATHECLDQNVLADRSGETRFYIGTALGRLNYVLMLPEGMTCPQCVLQWKWHCENSPGHGIAQEEFYACADVTILPRDGQFPETTPRPTTPSPTTPTPTTPRPTTTPKPTTPTTTSTTTISTTHRPPPTTTSTTTTPLPTTTPTPTTAEPSTTTKFNGIKNEDGHFGSIIKNPTNENNENNQEINNLLNFFLNGPSRFQQQQLQQQARNTTVGSGSFSLG